MPESVTKPGKSPDPLSAALDRASFVPYYRQIADHIRGLIESEKLSAGQALWSEGEVAKQFGVSKMTVRQAFNALRMEGLLAIEKGKIPRVGAGSMVKNFQELRGFTEEMRHRGISTSSRVLTLGLQYPDPETAEALELQDGEQVYRLRRLRLASGQVAGLETTMLPERLFPHLDEQDLEKQSLYHVMESIYGVQLEYSEEVLQAVPARAEEARLLKVKPRFPLFAMRRKVYNSQKRPAEYGISLFRGDRYSASIVSYRKK